MTRSARPARSRPNVDTRARILTAARELVARHGYTGTSISLICHDAGINASSLYWFFSSKEDLFLAVIEEGAADFLKAVALPANERPAHQDAMATVARRLADNALFLRVLLVMMLEARDLSPAFRAKVAEIRARSLEWWRALLEGMFAPLGNTGARLLAADMALLCRSAINGAFIGEQFGEAVSVETVMRQLLMLIECLVQRLQRERRAAKRKQSP